MRLTRPGPVAPPGGRMRGSFGGGGPAPARRESWRWFPATPTGAFDRRPIEQPPSLHVRLVPTMCRPIRCHPGRCPMSGPLTGLRLIELAGLGPAPFAGMMLADAGADIIRIDRFDRATYPPRQEPHVDLMNRGRRSVAVDLKHADGVALVLRLVESAGGLMEGFRPGVAERLGLGPDICLARNAKLVYGRMTGCGQTGPMAQAAGHDIDYIALAGALEAIGRAGEKPLP